eukprot:TRINITY_DN5207_c0_g1_i2.p2 TRINITY_DN5207_c0_g1~~TRINITY_DN5207_c0_g1_i2.p2  ORF type:complete len:135 (+),score=46.80 TRINITY_DN5207_c0_g1_i2:83-487(+)
MIRRPPRSTLSSSSAASDVYKRQVDIHTATKEGLLTDLELVCEHAPHRVHERTELEQYTVLHQAAIYHSRPQVAKLLIHARVDPNAKDKGNYTPLHKAAIYNSTEIATELILAGADPSARAAIPVVRAARVAES